MKIHLDQWIRHSFGIDITSPDDTELDPTTSNSNLLNSQSNPDSHSHSNANETSTSNQSDAIGGMVGGGSSNDTWDWGLGGNTTSNGASTGMATATQAHPSQQTTVTVNTTLLSKLEDNKRKAMELLAAKKRQREEREQKERQEREESERRKSEAGDIDNSNDANGQEEMDMEVEMEHEFKEREIDEDIKFQKEIELDEEIAKEMMMEMEDF
ncbi:hypothetical protein BKA69DRAFT_755302 [Paraphysoderma sedebokerense]|nr:hypothetical protein BKA69DRAFT_755302 [Paraphysoderma sedebokerense]